MKKISIIFAFLLFFLTNSFSQKRVVINGDTVVTLAPKSVAKINRMLEDRLWLKRENTLKDSLIVIKDMRLTEKDKLTEEIILKNEIERDLAEKRANSRVRKSVFISVLVGIVFGILVK